MIKIFVIEDGEEKEITEWMYWFEETGIQDINDMKFHGREVGLRIEIDGVVVFPVKESDKHPCPDCGGKLVPLKEDGKFVGIFECEKCKKLVPVLA